MLPLFTRPRTIDPDDLRACRALLRDGSRTFHAASFLLPAAVRAPATALYAFCRLADDAVDLDHVPEAALPRLRERLRLVYCGTPVDLAADRAFAATVAGFGIPMELPEALLEGFAWDAAGRRYATLSQLTEYAARVAGSVGAMMAMVMGVREPAIVARACELGIAMQLSNIARDVGEDARAGRLYLPLDWLQEAGIDPDAWLAEPRFDARLGGVVRRLLEAAELLYRRSEAGIAVLPAGCRPGIRAARLLYAAIGHEVARRGFDSVAGRARVPARRKLLLLPRALLAPVPERRAPATCLDEARFLVDCLPGGVPAQTEAAVEGLWRSLDARAAWLIDLFARLERREQLQRSRS